MSEDSSAHDLVLLTSSKFPVGIEILRARLESEGMRVVVLNKMDSSYLNFGDVELYVDREDFLKAKRFLDAQD